MTQRSILAMFKSRMKSSVAQYLQAKEKLDQCDDDEYESLRDRERLLRGVVRGSAQMYLALANPAAAKNKDAINDLEIDYGMPGKRSRPRAKSSESVIKFLEEYYDE